MTTDHFRFAPSMLARLGEELVPSPEQGLIELILNAYDADATKCTVQLDRTSQVGGSITVTDNGKGMDGDEVTGGWLVFGASTKTTRRTSLGRLQVGEKGIGRLAALRLGHTVELCTVSAKSPSRESSLSFDWSVFEAARAIEDVPLDVKSRRSARDPGTTLRILNLRRPFGRREATRLARALLLLGQPFPDSPSDFSIELIAEEFPELQRLTRESYFDDADFRLEARIGADGFGRASVTDWKGATLWEATHADLRRRRELRDAPYRTDSLGFEFWTFTLDSASFSTKRATFTEVRSWLRELGGVYVFRRGVRVAPYGDDDWLGLNLSRARTPEERPSTNNSIGRILIEGEGNSFTPKTDRTGFVEDQAFVDMRQFANDAIDWMSRRRLQASEVRREAARAGNERTTAQAQTTLRKAIATLPPRTADTAERALERLVTSHSRETRRLREDVQLYRTLATVGTTVSVFAHELGKKVSRVSRLLTRIAEAVPDAVPRNRSAERAKLLALVENAATSAKSAGSYTAIPLHLLEKPKRRVGEVHVHQVIQGVLRDFGIALEESKVSPEPTLAADADAVLGSESAIEVILANLITNAINAFGADGAPSRKRRIQISTRNDGANLQLIFDDSGPGIVLPLEDIWLPGQTTTAGGTGLGLTIIKDVVTELGGSAEAEANGPLGGARFVISLPLMNEG